MSRVRFEDRGSLVTDFDPHLDGLLAACGAGWRYDTKITGRS
jgi:hypothetical protein